MSWARVGSGSLRNFSLVASCQVAKVVADTLEVYRFGSYLWNSSYTYLPPSHLDCSTQPCSYSRRCAWVPTAANCCCIMWIWMVGYVLVITVGPAARGINHATATVLVLVQTCITILVLSVWYNSKFHGTVSSWLVKCARQRPQNMFFQGCYWNMLYQRQFLLRSRLYDGCMACFSCFVLFFFCSRVQGKYISAMSNPHIGLGFGCLQKSVWQ